MTGVARAGAAAPSLFLAFDFGTKRIGVAVGDFETRLAHPLTILTAADNRARFAAIERLIAEWRPALLVVGVPARTDGAEHPVGRLARRFAQRGLDVDGGCHPVCYRDGDGDDDNGPEISAHHEGRLEVSKAWKCGVARGHGRVLDGPRDAEGVPADA